MEHVRHLALMCWREQIFHRALMVALVVGSVLNLINQGDALTAGRPLSWPKLLLTYVVPFVVSTHGALATRRH